MLKIPLFNQHYFMYHSITVLFVLPIFIFATICASLYLNSDCRKACSKQVEIGRVSLGG